MPPIALDKKLVEVDGCAEKIPALDPSRVSNINFIGYIPPPADAGDHAGQEEWMERAGFIEEDLNTLLRLPHDKFWCQVIFDGSLHRSIDSYLRSVPRSYDVVYALPSRLQEQHNKLHRAFFMVCLRMATHKESKDDFITPHVFGDILYENFIFDMPKLLDICVLYGADNGPLLTKMISNIFHQQPKYIDDLHSIVPAVLQVLETIVRKCGLQVDSHSSPQKLDGPAPGTTRLNTMGTNEFQDIIFYLWDTAKTLSSFFEVYSDATKAFVADDFPIRWASLCECLITGIATAFHEREDWGRQSVLKPLLKSKFSAAQATLVQVFRKIIFSNCLQPLMEDSREQEGEVYVERFIHMMSAVLGERRFIALNEALHPFSDDRDLLIQAQSGLDETQLQFLEDGVRQAFSHHGKKRRTDSGTIRTKGPSHENHVSNGNISPEPVTLPAGMAGANREEQLGACAPSMKGIELESLITSVKDLLPDLGEGFIELCLEELNYDVERVINAVLEHKLPPSLCDIDMTIAREKPPVTQDDPGSLLEQRRNVFDNDEFDVFSKDKVDLSCIHQGKKEQSVDLDDKSHLAELQPLFQRYGSEFVESMYDKTVEYEDEYDDTYDSNLVGADDADDAEELTSRTLRNPRVFGLSKDSSDTHTSTPTEDSGNSEDEQGSRDAFLEDPAKIRERQAQRQASRAARAGHKPQAPQKVHDVKGQAKGQGQTKEVVHNRAWKEKNKASRVHHNRKALSDKKRKI